MVDNQNNRLKKSDLGAITRRLKLLAEAIKEIDEAILARRELSAKFRNQIEKEIQEVQQYLATLQPPWRAGYLPQYEFLRVSLHKSLASRKQNKRSEELKLWEDLTKLLKERRELIFEYEELLSIVNGTNNNSKNNNTAR
jgi:hypothetical protein